MELRNAQPRHSISSDEMLHRLALALVPNIGDAHTKSLIMHFGSARSVFEARQSSLEGLEGIGAIRARAIKQFRSFERAEKELAFCEEHGIRPLFLTDQDYPSRLRHCEDAPALLFYKGEASLNHHRTVSIVGTRNHTEYGRQLTEKLMIGLSGCRPLIVSGLAYGIDGLAHRYAIRHQIPTVGVLAHGLDRIYPPSHIGLARDMLQAKGGLLTEFFSGTQPDRFNFPLRNRIVAGLSDAVVVIETHTTGGSMITAKIAHSYNREVFAYPGRPDDHHSKGCNELIRNHQAIMITHPDQIADEMGWISTRILKTPAPELFSDLSPPQQAVLDWLRLHGPTHVDELRIAIKMDGTALASALLALELSMTIRSLPGKVYAAL